MTAVLSAASAPAVVQDRTHLPLKWRPVDPGKLAGLPAPWPRLKSGFQPTLYNRVERFWTGAVEDGNEQWLIEPVTVLGESYAGTFNRTAYPHTHYAGFCTDKWLDALEELAREFPLISPILWETLAALGTRDNPLEEDTIPNVKGLPYAWGICDAAVHALGKTFPLHFHVQERLREYSGHVFQHLCGCSHILQDLQQFDGRFPLVPDTEAVKFHQEKAWLDHLLSELYLMFVAGFPFRMNPEDFNSTKVVALKD